MRRICWWPVVYPHKGAIIWKSGDRVPVVMPSCNYNVEFKHSSSTGSPVRTIQSSWWRHQMETFSALLALCVGNSPVTGEFPSKRPATQSFDVFFYLRLNKRLGKQPKRRWLETPSRLSWRHFNGTNDTVGRRKDPGNGTCHAALSYHQLMGNIFSRNESPIAKTIGSISIRHRSDAKVSEPCLIDVDPMVFVIYNCDY